MPPPQAQPVVFIQATQPEPPRRRRRGNLGSKAANRFMLMATALWLLTMFGTVVYFAFALSERPGAEPTAWAGAVIAGSVCMWCFETLIYGVTMVVLWVVRENFRD